MLLRRLFGAINFCPVNCYLFNAQSVVNKFHELHDLLYNESCDFVFITETWLSANISSGLLDPMSTYNIFRKDRLNKKCGGVCVLVKNCWHVAHIPLCDTFSDLEILCLELNDVKPCLRFFVIYRPPCSDDSAVKNASLLVECLQQYAVDCHFNIIVGDLNLPKISWQKASCPGDKVHSLIYDFFVQNGYTQFVNFDTRGSNILDVVLADDDQIISQTLPCLPIGHSDHRVVKFLIVFDTNDYISETRCDFTKYLWRKADYDSMCNFLQEIDWISLVYNNPCAESMWSAFQSILYYAIELFVPFHCNKLAPMRSKNRKRHSVIVHKCSIKKRALWNKLQSNPHDAKSKREYRECVSEWRRLLRNQEIEAERRIIDANNLGLFYQHVNNRIGHRSNVGAIVNDQGMIITDDVTKANTFNTYFGSVAIIDDNIIPQFYESIHVEKLLESIAIDESDVVMAINRLKSNYSCGPDRLPPAMFKHCVRVLAAPLTLIYNQLLSVSCVPEDWKQAIIVPVLKKGAAGAVANYRPISLTCVPSKIVERIICQKIFQHLQSNGILHPAQHGFQKGRSTCSNLLESLNDWTQVIESRQCLAVIYIDFSKAFDTVSHKKLFARLHSYGIRGSLLLWLQRFFENRTQQTKIGTAFSDIIKLLSGIIQGSGIGPLMFLIFINELIAILESYEIKAKLFADDVKLYSAIIKSADATNLQAALDSLSKWAKTWQLSLSISKCCVLNIGKSQISYNFCVDGVSLPDVPSCVDLGITMTSNLTFTDHINVIVSKAHQRANLIHRCFVSRDISLLMRAYLVYVRPLVEHNSVIWSPRLIKDIETVEQVQRRFTKRLPGFKHFAYAERLSRLHLHSLELRRLHADLIMCYKIIFGHIMVNANEFFKLNTSNITRGHAYRLHKQFNHSSTRISFFAIRVINVWNYLPADVVDFSSLSSFKNTITLVDFTRFLKCF